jgi:hypothetical protein
MIPGSASFEASWSRLRGHPVVWFVRRDAGLAPVARPLIGSITVCCTSLAVHEDSLPMARLCCLQLSSLLHSESAVEDGYVGGPSIPPPCAGHPANTGSLPEPPCTTHFAYSPMHQCIGRIILGRKIHAFMHSLLLTRVKLGSNAGSHT